MTRLMSSGCCAPAGPARTTRGSTTRILRMTSDAPWPGPLPGVRVLRCERLGDDISREPRHIARDDVMDFRGAGAGDAVTAPRGDRPAGQPGCVRARSY